MCEFLPILLVTGLDVFIGLITLGPGHPFIATSSLGHYLMSLPLPIPPSLLFISIHLSIIAALVLFVCNCK